MFIRSFCMNMFLILLGTYLGVELLNPMVTLCLSFKDLPDCFSEVARLLYNLISNVWGFQFL